MNATGADMVVAEARIAYRASARFDDELDLVAGVCPWGDLDDHGLSVERMPAGEVLAEGELRHVFVDPRRCGSARSRTR